MLYIDIIVYQRGNVIIKLECVGHYQKRMGTRLRNLKKKEKGLGARCSLTDTTMIDCRIMKV